MTKLPARQRPLTTMKLLKELFEKFNEKHGHYPTYKEIEEDEYFPTLRTIQRRFGGLEKVRIELGIPFPNHSKGEMRVNKMKDVLARQKETENEVYQVILKYFDDVSVHRERPFADDSRNRSDFFIFRNKKSSLIIDVFYPSDIHSFSGCLNSKLLKYYFFDVPVTFVQMNKDISSERINKYLKNRKNKIDSRFKIISFHEEFEEYIKNMV